jgi:hypothetical protein
MDPLPVFVVYANLPSSLRITQQAAVGRRGAGACNKALDFSYSAAHIATGPGLKNGGFSKDTSRNC